jgi:hypothetical protein
VGGHEGRCWPFVDELDEVVAREYFANLAADSTLVGLEAHPKGPWIVSIRSHGALLFGGRQAATP